MDLARLFDGLRRNDISRLLEIIVVDDGSVGTAMEPGSAVGLPVRVIKLAHHSGPNKARNIAAAEALGNYLAFFDDDAIPVPDWMSHVLPALDGGYDAVTGPVLRFDQGLISRARQARYDVRYSLLRHSDAVSFFAGGNSAIKTALFNELGGFSSNAVGGDNSVAQALSEANSAVRFLPDALILHRNGKGIRSAISNAFLAGEASCSTIRLVDRLSRIARAKGFIGQAIDERLANGLLDMVNVLGAVRGKSKGTSR
ncbi:glycosyltransferase [Sinorhizobium meliloti]|uniref:glycosyltransferase family 2 protein n=1 Tax=Rhizobium meliloti TaxID=382 RepID=UPI0020744F26|nr:glycosyltransferase family 2 protein [Sinorhizobium meliloti]MCM5693039.1 glycosyltransferase [Sinorhizobium meliloti]